MPDQLISKSAVLKAVDEEPDTSFDVTDAKQYIRRRIEAIEHHPESDVLKSVDDFFNTTEPKDVIDGDLSLAGEVMASAILQRVRELIHRRIEEIQE